MILLSNFLVVINLKKIIEKNNSNKKYLLSTLNITCFLIMIMVIIGAFITPFSSNASTINTSAAKVNSEILGNESIGYVTKEGPYGNPESSTKIAYILGMHPRESRSHNATMALIRNNSNSLENCYYLYLINVTQNTYDYYPGRLNGQKLAYKYVVPDINLYNYSLVIDVHASNGLYINTPYVFVPKNDTRSLKISNNLSNSLDWLYYFDLPDPSSPDYCTIPIIENGTPAIIFEAFGSHNNTIKNQVNQFIWAVDQLKI